MRRAQQLCVDLGANVIRLRNAKRPRKPRIVVTELIEYDV